MGPITITDRFCQRGICGAMQGWDDRVCGAGRCRQAWGAQASGGATSTYCTGSPTSCALPRASHPASPLQVPPSHAARVRRQHASAALGTACMQELVTVEEELHLAAHLAGTRSDSVRASAQAQRLVHSVIACLGT